MAPAVHDTQSFSLCSTPAPELDEPAQKARALASLGMTLGAWRSGLTRVRWLMKDSLITKHTCRPMHFHSHKKSTALLIRLNLT